MLTDIARRSPTWIAMVLVAACGGGGDGGGEPAAEEEAAPPAPPAVDPAEAATIQGRIAFSGEVPASQPIDMAEEPSCAEGYGAEGPMTQGVLVSDGGLGNVFVYVKEGLARSFPTPEAPVRLNQENCRYAPHVLGVQTEQPLKILNSDDLLHNINANPTANRGFNISQPRGGMESTQTFRVAEIMIPVKCDVHGWMNAYVGVLDHPYFTVSAADGAFEIAGLPPGEYVVEAWHEHYGTMTQAVTIGAQETAEVTFEYDASMAAGAEVPLGDPLVVRHDEGGMRVTRESEIETAGR